MNSDMKAEDIFQDLKEVANSDDAVHMKVYMKNQFEFLGVKTPIRRQISKIFFKKSHKSTIDWKFIRLGKIPIVKCNMWCWIIYN